MKKVSMSLLIICCVLCMAIAASCDSSESIRDELKDVKTGDIIQFGKDDEGNVINWVVYDRSVNTITAISTDFVATKSFDSHGKAYFNSSDLGLWVQDSFYNSSFSDVEKNIIEKDKNTNVPQIGLPFDTEIEEIQSDGFINPDFKNSFTPTKDVCWVEAFFGDGDVALYIPTENELLYFNYDGKMEGYNVNTDKKYYDNSQYSNNLLTSMSSTAQKYITTSEQEFLQNKAGVRLLIYISLENSEDNN